MEKLFENIQLPGFVLAGLYPKELVVLDEAKPASQKVAAIEATFYLGNNAKHILIVVQDDTATYLRDEWLQLLTNMLTACNLNMGDVAIVNLLKHPSSFIELKEKLTPDYCLLFGATTQTIDLPFIIPHYQIQKHNQCSFVAAPAFTALEGSTQEAKIEKSKLWLSLKKIFNI